MKRILLAAILALATSTIEAQTTGAPVAGIYQSSSGSLIGARNLLTGREEPFSLNTFTGPLSPTKGGTGVANAATQTLTRSGAHGLTITTTGTTGVTLPTSGTVCASGNACTATSFIPSSATVPTNGMYLGAANSLAFATDTTHRWTINASGALNCATDGGCDIGNGSADPRDISITRNLTLRTATTVAAAAACTAGTIYWDADYLYVCTATGVVKRAALTGGY